MNPPRSLGGPLAVTRSRTQMFLDHSDANVRGNEEQYMTENKNPDMDG